jgi:hypothetical protein
MVKYIVLAALLLATIHSPAQTFSLDKFNEKAHKTTQTGMLVLSSWAVANIGTGFIAAGQASGSDKYMHQMNAYFNIVNLAIAQAGYWGSRKRMKNKQSFSQAFKQQNSEEKTFLLNAGLDAAYILGGLYWAELGKRHPGEKKYFQYRGYGKSLVLQGGFLMIFDGIMYTIRNKQGKILAKQLENIDLAVAPGGIGLVYRF